MIQGIVGTDKGELANTATNILEHAADLDGLTFGGFGTFDELERKIGLAVIVIKSDKGYHVQISLDGDFELVYSAILEEFDFDSAGEAIEAGIFKFLSRL